MLQGFTSSSTSKRRRTWGILNNIRYRNSLDALPHFSLTLAANGLQEGLLEGEPSEGRRLYRSKCGIWST